MSRYARRRDGEQRRSICVVCSVEVWAGGRRKYCDEHTRRGPKKRPPTLNQTCEKCGVKYHGYATKSRPRRFCSYQCHLDSGGARRAGDASARAKMRYGVKKDANHNEIVEALNYFGAEVLDLSPMGCGVPDLLVWCRGNWHLCDVKNRKTGYGRRGLNPRQREWAESWRGGPVTLLYSLDDAKALVEGRMDALKNVGSA